MSEPLPILKGTLDVLVLKALAFAPMHGFEIVSWLEQRSSGSFDVDDGALYYALHRMEERDFVSSEWRQTENNRRARYYTLTSAGALEFATYSAEWRRTSEAVNRVLRFAFEA